MYFITTVLKHNVMLHSSLCCSEFFFLTEIPYSVIIISTQHFHFDVISLDYFQ